MITNWYTAERALSWDKNLRTNSLPGTLQSLGNMFPVLTRFKPLSSIAVTLADVI